MLRVMALIRVGWARLGAWCVRDDTDTEQAEDGADEVVAVGAELVESHGSGKIKRGLAVR
jgi:hypothetical protein